MMCPSILIAREGNIGNKLRIQVGAGGPEKHACSPKAAPAGNACCIKSRGIDVAETMSAFVCVAGSGSADAQDLDR